MSSTRSVEVRINGGTREVPDGLSVEDLLRYLDLHPRMVVVERNGEILRREGYASAPVRSGDELELVHFVGGG